MFNSQLRNTSPYNLSEPFQEGVVSVAAYNGYSFNSEVFTLTEMPDIENLPTLKFNDYDIAEAHGEGLYSYYFRNKPIVLKGVLRGVTINDLESKIVVLKAALSKHNKLFKYQRRDGKLLQTRASCTGIRFDRKHYHLTFVPVEIEIIFQEPFFYEVASREEAFQGVNDTLSASVAYTQGSFNAYPLILLSFVDATDVTEIQVNLNGTNITINENISTSDNVIIDCKARDISINSIPGVDYIGAFPELEIGVNEFEVTMDGTYEVDIYVQRHNTYV